MKGWLDEMESRGYGVARFCALCGMVGLVALTLLTDFDVFMRWAFNSPIDGIADLAPLIVVVGVTSFFPFALAERRHIAINALGNLLGARARAWHDVLVAVVTLVFFVLLAWQIIVYTIDLRELGQTTWVVRLPVAPWWTVVSCFLVLCVAVQLNILLAHLGSAIAPDDSAQHAPAPPEETTHTDGGS
jgi:TRAP-type C4-dicarboxylate transport system permease small subunit